MKCLMTVVLAVILSSMSATTAFADVIPSHKVIAQQEYAYNKQQILAMLDTEAVSNKLIALGVDKAHAKSRIENMTQQELLSFQQQLNDMPAGQGIVGTIVTVLVVVAVLDVMGITDVYPFIRPL